jgi:hypothetical protein
MLATCKNTMNTAENHILVRRCTDFEVTGDGREGQWNKSEWVTLPPRSGEKSYQTRIKTLYSDKGVYILFWCEDGTITSTRTEDFSDLYNEDVVEVFFWTDESAKLYFEYEVSPLNKELVLLIPNFNGDFYGWRPWNYEGEKLVRHATTLFKESPEDGVPQYWMAEMFIPFALLKPLQNVPATSGMKWRANFYRIDYDAGVSTWAWQPTEKNFHEPEKFGTMVFE